MSRRLAAVGVAVLAFAFAPPLALARPGGGHSFHGGSHSSSHSSHSSSHSSSSHSSSHHSSHVSSSHGSTGSGQYAAGDGEADDVAGTVATGARTVAFFATAGFGLLGLFLVVVMLAVVGRVHAHWDSDHGPLEAPSAIDSLDALRQLDPEFSAVLFQDFAYALYARSHEARANAKRLAALGPYLSDEARAHLASRDPKGSPVEAVVIGAMRIEDVTRRAEAVTVALAFEANLVVAAPGGERTQYVKESWWLQRPASAVTRAWKGVRSFGCPACGAALSEDASGLCGHCGQRVDDGRSDWRVARIALGELEDRPPSLTGTVEEEGTDAPTIYQDGCAERLASLLAADPALSLEGLSQRLGLVFDELQKAWAAQDLRGVRPFVSASLFNYLTYWVSAYKQQGLCNRVDGARIVKSECCRVLHDAHYDALTLRVFGTGRDYTFRVGSGELVGGSRDRERPYSEYWTLIRGAAVRGAPRADGSCPSCGAALKVNMEGNCEYCGALVASGDFDWVLSQIEQDDSHSG